MTERKNISSEKVIDTSAAPGEIREMQVLEALTVMVGRDLGVPDEVLSGEVVPELPTRDSRNPNQPLVGEVIKPTMPDSAA